MDENQKDMNEAEVPAEAAEEQKTETHEPRPAWQIWGARIALVVFILYLIMYYINIMRGGS